MGTILQTGDQLVQHGEPCFNFTGATVERGTPKPGDPYVQPIGEAALPTGTITFRNRDTGAVIGTMSTTTGSFFGYRGPLVRELFGELTPVANVQTYVNAVVEVTPARLERRVQVLLWNVTSNTKT